MAICRHFFFRRGRFGRPEGTRREQRLRPAQVRHPPRRGARPPGSRTAHCRRRVGRRSISVVGRSAKRRPGRINLQRHDLGVPRPRSSRTASRSPPKHRPSRTSSCPRQAPSSPYKGRANPSDALGDAARLNLLRSMASPNWPTRCHDVEGFAPFGEGSLGLSGLVLLSASCRLCVRPALTS